jgi:hypothetical protein
MSPSQSGVYNEFPYSTGSKGLMSPSRSGVYYKFPYSTAPEGLMSLYSDGDVYHFFEALLIKDGRAKFVLNRRAGYCGC